MPTYKVTLSDGRVVTLEAASPPSESDILGAMGAKGEQAPPQSAFDTARHVLGTMNPGGLPGPIMGAMGRSIGNQMIDVAEDPTRLIPMAGGAIGAAGGTALGGPGGGVAGAAALGGAGKSLQNYIKARPLSEGVLTEAALQGGMQAIPMAGAPLLKVGTAWYRKTLAPAASDLAKIAKSSAMPATDAAAQKLAETGMKHRLVISRRGVQKADELISSLDDQGRALVTDAAQAGATASPVDVRRDAYGYMRRKFGPQAQTFAEGDMAAARAKAAEFSRNPTVSESHLDPITGAPVRTLKSDVPVDVMDELRRGTMRGVRNKYGQGLKDAGTEAEKAFGHSEREAVVKAVDATVPAGKPNLSQLRGEEKELLDLSKSMVRRQTGAANASLFRLYEFLGILSGNPSAIGLGMLSRPGLASRGAIGMGDIGRAVETVDPNVYRAALLALMGKQPPPSQDK